jgi:hypothetical protein
VGTSAVGQDNLDGEGDSPPVVGTDSGLESDVPDIEAEVIDDSIFSENWRWSSPTLATVGREAVAALAGPRPGSSMVFAQLEDGSVWRSLDSGDGWVQIMERFDSVTETGVSQEELLLEAESILEDLVGVETSDEFEPDDGESEEPQETVTSSIEEVDSLAIESLLSNPESSENSQALLWVHPRFPDLLLVGRPDGLWRSGDAGESFHLVQPNVTMNAIATGTTSLIVGATEQGLLYSFDGGRSWIDKVDMYDDFRVADIQVFDGTWWMASDHGLHYSVDGESWAPTNVVEPTLTLSSGGSSNHWVASERGLLKLEGDSAYRASRQSLPTTSTILEMTRPGHLLVSGADGVWESIDGGIVWRPVSTGLYMPLVNDLWMTSRGLIAATPRGLRRLVEYNPIEEQPDNSQEIQDSVDLTALIFAAVSRPGMSPAAYGVDRIVTSVRRFAPELTIDGQYVQRNNLSADFFNYSNAADTDRDWRIMAYLSWGAGGDESSDYDATPIEDLFYVLRDRIYSNDSAGDITSVASRLMVDSNDYRAEVEATVAELFFSRRRLLERSPPDERVDLREAVLYDLDVQELNGWIDAYTDNALSRAL